MEQGTTRGVALILLSHGRENRTCTLQREGVRTGNECIVKPPSVSGLGSVRKRVRDDICFSSARIGALAPLRLNQLRGSG